MLGLSSSGEKREDGSGYSDGEQNLQPVHNGHTQSVEKAGVEKIFC
jgi:hypothetical protein